MVPKINKKLHRTQLLKLSKEKKMLVVNLKGLIKEYQILKVISVETTDLSPGCQQP